MSKVRDLHEQAMKLAQLAVLARLNQEPEQAIEFAQQASSLEAQAAFLIPEGSESEPTRSILFRSAASLAYQSKDFELAQRLIAYGLTGYPPRHVEDELKDLFEQINFERHLKFQAIEIADQELQFSLQGNHVGYGTILYNEFVHRLKTVKTIIDRTTQRLLGAPFQGVGRTAKSIQPFNHSLALKPGSFKVSFQLAYPSGGQPTFLVDIPTIIDDIIVNVELFENGDETELKNRIREDVYYQNFVALTRDIAPDGEQITSIGFSSLKREVKLTRKRDDSRIFTPSTLDGHQDQTEYIEVKGLLDYANARKKEEALGLTTDNDQKYILLVDEGLVDLVRSYFKQQVVVRGQLKRKYHIHVEDIQPCEE
jgi:hypothetical protein